jgi:hypothetical protein
MHRGENQKGLQSISQDLKVLIDFFLVLVIKEIINTYIIYVYMSGEQR